MNENVLVISADEQVSAAVTDGGYRVTVCRDVNEIPNKCAAELVLADGDICGTEYVERLGERLCVPIMLIVSAENIGAETADDFIIKPINAKELPARIGALLRRRSKRVFDEITIGELRLNNAAHRCTIGGKDVLLTPMEFRILWYLCERRGRVVTSKELFENVWGEEYLDSSGTVMPHIARIRSKLNEPPRRPRYLKTVWGVGYKVDND